MNTKEESGKRAWRGVNWIRPVNGRCPKHEIEVGPITRLCHLCNREQLEAAAKGSREWEMESLRKEIK